MDDKNSPIVPTEPPARPSGPQELRLLLPEERTRLSAVFGGAGLIHAAFLILVILLAWARPEPRMLALTMEATRTDIVFLDDPGPGGGGGGGGDRAPEPPKQAVQPAVKPSEPIPTPVEEPVPPPEPEPAVVIPAVTPERTLAALAEAPNVDATSRGPGSGGGVDTGNGRGAGPGDGVGDGPGVRDGTGGGPPGGGSGASSPILMFKPRPAYTPEAVLRGITGEVHLNCVVLATGAVGDCDITRSLDRNAYGLDNEALKTAKLFRFRPGERRGEPVPVLVGIVLEFNMR